MSNTLTVRKRIDPWSAYARAAGVDAKEIQRVYSLTANKAGLVHAVPPNSAPTVQTPCLPAKISLLWPRTACCTALELCTR
jgi:hypothetical protein